MNRALWILLGLMLFVGLTLHSNPAHSYDKTTRAILLEARDAVKLATDNGGTGSAVIIAPGVVATAAHVVPKNSVLRIPQQLKIHVSDSVEVESQVLYINTDTDVAILSAPVSCPCLRIASSPPQMDETVYAIGYPYGSMLDDVQVLTEGAYQGIVTQHGKNNKEEEFYLATAQVSPGNSGGALIVIRGGIPYLVGITSAIAAPSRSNTVKYLAFFVTLKNLKIAVAKAQGLK